MHLNIALLWSIFIEEIFCPLGDRYSSFNWLDYVMTDQRMQSFAWKPVILMPGWSRRSQTFSPGIQLNRTYTVQRFSGNNRQAFSLPEN